jgi:hypothetical protein
MDTAMHLSSHPDSPPAEGGAEPPFAADTRAVARPDLGVGLAQPSRWITRERPKIDRIACPWLVLRFIDPRAEFHFVPTQQVFSEAKRLNALAYDIPGAPISHEGELCSFDALLAAFGLRSLALERLAHIVRGADTDQLHLAPQSAGLMALSLGLSRLHQDDHRMLEAALPMYDALYAWCRDAQDEPHSWRPETMVTRP